MSLPAAAHDQVAGSAGAAEWLRSAAFGATPGADVFAGTTDGPRSRWLAAVVLGGQGRYAAAASRLRGLCAHPVPLWASLAHSTLASHRRQLGAHAAARRLDAAALRLSSGLPVGLPSSQDRPPRLARPGDPEIDPDGVTGEGDPDGTDLAGARADALAGLVADAIGMGELATAERLLAAAGRSTALAAGWRQRLRLDWIRAEFELASGRPQPALAPATRALRLAEQVGSARHQAKSLLILAAAMDAAGDSAAAADLLHGLSAEVHGHGLLSLRWPAELLLAQLHERVAQEHEHARWHRAAAFAALRLVLRRTDVSLRTAAESSLWVPSEVLQTGDSAERSSAGEILSKICIRLCQGSTPRDR